MTLTSIRELALVLAVGVAGSAAALGLSFRGPALADEFGYQVGARRFADTGSLDAIYYSSATILNVGFPHQDAHTPGYLICLGMVGRVFGPGYPSAVLLNIACLLVAMAMLWQLARDMGRPSVGRLLTAGGVAVPGLVAYVSWVMSDMLVCASSVATLWVAARWGRRRSGALACGLALGACFLVRESAVFLLPALVLLIGASGLRLSLFAGTFLAFQLLVWAPLNADRPPASSTTVGGSALASARRTAATEGRGLDAAAYLGGRARRNLEGLMKSGAVEQSVLAGLLAVPAITWLGWRELSPLARRLLAGLSLGLLGAVAATTALVDLGNGRRYWLFLVMPFVALLPVPQTRGRRALLSVAAAAGVLTTVAALVNLRQFKSKGSEIDEIAYFDAYAPPGSYSRVIWQNGYALGLRRYPVEVIVGIPQSRGEYRALERAVWFDYVVLSTWQTALDDRKGYVLVNREDPDPLLKIFHRLR